MRVYLLRLGAPLGDVGLCVEGGAILWSALKSPQGAEPAPAGWEKALWDHLLGRGRFPLPLDFQGIPAFHAAALRAALEIPAGATATYGEIARRAGSPGAARAVGQAMAQNPFALLVPCHRVVPKAGGPGRYSGPGGARTKAMLLAWERAAAGGTT